MRAQLDGAIALSAIAPDLAAGDDQAHLSNLAVSVDGCPTG
jgi:hypothetical protein